MNSSLSDRCTVSISTILEGQMLPVKNTFIHFTDDDLNFRNSGVQRFKTDPSSEARKQSILSSFDEDNATDVPSASNSGGSTPRTSSEEGSSAETSLPQLLPPCAADLAVSPLVDWMSRPLPMPVSRASRQGDNPAAQQLQAAATGTATRRAPSYIRLDNGSVYFRFMLRRAEVAEWGLDVTPFENMVECGIEQALRVDGVVQGGAIYAWNRQVIDGPKADRAIQVGDLILSINSKRECQAMLDESNAKLLLEIQVLRQSPQAMTSDTCPPKA